MNGNKLDFMNISINNIDKKYLELLKDSKPDIDFDLKDKNSIRDYLYSKFNNKENQR